MSDSNKLIIVPMPGLVSVLLRREQEKGSPLTEAEVLSIRDGCDTVAVPRDKVAAIVESRGYEDIDPERCWEQWQEVRIQLHEKPDA